MLNNQLASSASAYSNACVGTGYLAFRDLPTLLNQYVQGPIALDYGCGRGRSSRFLQQHGYQVDAIDCCPHMIAQAKAQDNTIAYRLVKPFEASLASEHYDVILAQLVLVEISSEQALLNMLAEQYNALKPKAILLHTTGSDVLLTGDWLTIKNQYTHNKHLANGQPGTVYLANRNLTLTSWYWSESFLEAMFVRMGFQLLHKHKPLGQTADQYHWRDEFQHSPYVNYVLQKA